jgi:hypothetical protein
MSNPPSTPNLPDPPTTPAPILVGVLYDYPQIDGGALFEDAVRIGIDEVAASGRLDRALELVPPDRERQRAHRGAHGRRGGGAVHQLHRR